MKKTIVYTFGAVFLLTGCSPFSTANLEQEVEAYNASVESLVETYIRQIPKEETQGILLSYVLKGERSSYIEEDVQLEALSEQDMADFKAPLVSKNEYYTTLNYKGVKQVLIVNGYKGKMVIEATWLENKVIAVEYTVMRGATYE